MDKLPTPSIADLIQADGSLRLDSASQWSDAASKMNFLLSAQRHGQQGPELTEAVQSMQARQAELALVCKKALLEALQIRAPKARHAVGTVLHCPQEKNKLTKDDFAAAIDVMQKVSDMNLKLLVTFDLALLGTEGTKKLNEFIDSVARFFSAATGVAGWLKPLRFAKCVFSFISIHSIL